MSAILSSRPGRWVRYCPEEVLDLCDFVGAADFLPQPWILSGGSLVGILVQINTMGIIASINSYPAGVVYTGAGSTVSAVTWDGSQYVPSVDAAIENGVFYVLIQGISVTLTDGSVCSVDFSQFFNATGTTPAPPEYALTTTKQTGFQFQIFTGSNTGTVQWGDTNSDPYDATSAPDTVTHTYGSPGTYIVQVFSDGNDTKGIDAASQDLTAADFSNADDLTSIDLGSNAALSSVTVASSSSATWTKFDLASCALSGTLSLSGLTGLGGDFEVNGNSGLTTLFLPTSSVAFTQFQAYSCGLNGTLDMSGLTGLAGNVQLNNNSLTQVTFPSTTGTLTRLHLNDNTPFTGVVDLSGVTLQTDLEARSLPSATGITFKAGGPWNMSNMQAYSSGWTSLDFSTFNLSGTFFLYSCSALTTVTFNASNTAKHTNFRLSNNSTLTTINNLSALNFNGSTRFDSNNLSSLTFGTNTGSSISTFYLFSNSLGYTDTTMLTYRTTSVIEWQNNGMTAAEVNHMLVDYDSNLGALGASTGTVRGDGTNAPADSSSGGYDGVTAKANLVANGWTVTTN